MGDGKQFREDPAENIVPKKPKQKWHFYLLLGILLLLVLFCVMGIVSSLLKQAASQRAQQKYTYTYVDTVNNLDLSKRPDTVSGLKGGALDYTIINDAITKTPEEVDRWIASYYPNSYTKKAKMEDQVEWWVITSSTPMPPISIDGYVFPYDQVEFHFRDGYAENVKFAVTQGCTENDFYATYHALEGKYGAKQLYQPKRDFLDKLIDPDIKYMSFSWWENDFDGFYHLTLVRTEHTNEESNYLLFAVD